MEDVLRKIYLKKHQDL